MQDDDVRKINKPWSKMTDEERKAIAARDPRQLKLFPEDAEGPRPLSLAWLMHKLRPKSKR